VGIIAGLVRTSGGRQVLQASLALIEFHHSTGTGGPLTLGKAILTRGGDVHADV